MQAIGLNFHEHSELCGFSPELTSSPLSRDLQDSSKTKAMVKARSLEATAEQDRADHLQNLISGVQSLLLLGISYKLFLT